MTHTPPPAQDDLAAGRELDALVAKMMGWHDLQMDIGHGGSSLLVGIPPASEVTRVPVPDYSTDMGAAWQIIEWAEASPRGWKLTLMRSGRSLPDYVWICTFHRGHVELARVVERSAPVVICKATLKAATCGSGPLL